MWPETDIGPMAGVRAPHALGPVAWYGAAPRSRTTRRTQRRLRLPPTWHLVLARRLARFAAQRGPHGRWIRGLNQQQALEHSIVSRPVAQFWLVFDTSSPRTTPRYCRRRDRGY
jgi:hypothetical protein